MSAIYITEGPLSEDDAHLYVEREEDRKVALCIRGGDYVALMGARQMGKTSLLLRQRRQLLGDGHIPIYVDLSPGKREGRESWYGYLESAVRGHLRRVAPHVSVPQMRNQFDFLSALHHIPSELGGARRVIFLLDETGAVPSHVAEPFFSTVRAVFNERAFVPELRRYVFVMAGSFIPDQLIKDPDVSPFNIARHVYMSDASASGIADLVRNLETPESPLPDEIAERVHYWTDGHLYFTQRLCSVLKEREPLELSPWSVDEAASAVISDENVARIYDKLEQDEEARQALKKRVLRRKRPFGDGPLRFNRASRLVARLELLGAVKCDAEDNCVVRNRIYEQALEQYFAGASRLRKRSMPQPPSSVWDQVLERVKGVLDNVIAGAVVASAAAIFGRERGFLQDPATRWQYIAISVAAIAFVTLAYTVWEQRRSR